MEFRNFYFLPVWNRGIKNYVNEAQIHVAMVTCWGIAMKNKANQEIAKNTMLEF